MLEHRNHEVFVIEAGHKDEVLFGIHISAK